MPRARRGATGNRRTGSFGERRAGAIGEHRPSARPTAPLVPAGAPKRRGWSALITVLVVPGLFATAGLPAYASGVEPEVQSASARASGQSFVVSAEAAAAAIARDGLTATSEEEMQARRADPRRAARLSAYAASGALEMGDDYPWFYQAADYEGGGLSPLGYYYRECVDFVAWRLNRDAGTTQAPFKWTWSKMTPRGGDASQWAMNWKANGWETGQQPVAGSVAWFAGNHVAYVKEVLDDGRVLIEEYNHKMQHKYGQRILDRSDIALFLYAPPA
ncbi:CHAP domain-containing protein [Naasia sp. SYSU D00057]|uniref:CHAP domain-containing protein n=1 Tax=Naasia sp. SYSU D00057 TaxID=2817380 RepID=UPI001B316EBD|nr:CHAP domain-containing protein [Naasia sp. SYSU D00057]